MKKIIFAILVLSALVLSSLPSSVLAIGQIAEPIIIKTAIRGQEIVSKLTVLNSEKNQSVIGLIAEGQIADWVKFYAKEDKEFQNPVTETTIPAGVYSDVGVLFKIPSDTANGTYTGELSVVYNPTQESSADETSSTVAQKISRAVEITVSDQEVISLEASVIPDKFDYATGEPLSLRIIYDNKSNIVLTPSVQIKIKQDDKTVYNVIYPYPEAEPAVRSMSLYEISPLSIPTASFGQGNFLAELTFLKGDQNILEKNFSFSVGTAGSVKGAFTNLKNSKILLAIIALIFIIFVVFLIKKNLNRPSTPVN